MLDLKDETVRKGILSGVISSVLILVFIQPLFNYLGPRILHFISDSFQVVSNMVYKNAAIGAKETIAVTFVTMFAGVACGASVSLISINFLRKKLKPLATVKGIGYLDKFTAVLLLFMSIFLLSNAFMDSINLQLNYYFQQRLTIIAPYISEQEEEVIRAKWAAMTSVLGYKQINLLLEETAKKNNISLPKAYYFGSS